MFLTSQFEHVCFLLIASFISMEICIILFDLIDDTSSFFYDSNINPN